MGIDWDMFAPDRLEMIWLGMLYRARHSEGYRRPPDEKTRDVDHVTGRPLREASLLPVGHAQWISGVELALTSPYEPDKLATACLGLHWKPRLKARTPEEQAIVDRIMADPKITEEEAQKLLPPVQSNWTDEENRCHAELKYRWQRAALLWSKKAPPWCEIRPPVTWEKDEDGFGPDGMPYVFRATHHALDEAELKIPGTKFARGAFSALATAPDDVKAHAAKVVPYALKAAGEVAGA